MLKNNDMYSLDIFNGLTKISEIVCGVFQLKNPWRICRQIL